MRKRLEKPETFCPPTIRNIKDKLNYHWELISGKISGYKADFVDYVINVSFPNFMVPFFKDEFKEIEETATEAFHKRFQLQSRPMIGFKSNEETYTDFDNIFHTICTNPQDISSRGIDFGDTIVTRRKLDDAEKYVLDKLAKDTDNPRYLGLGFCFTKIVPTFYQYKSKNEKYFDKMTEHIDYFIETPKILLPKRT